MTRVWRVGDLKPDLIVRLYNEDGSTFNAEDADSVTLVGIREVDGSQAFKRQVDNVVYDPDSKTSRATMLLQPDDTSVASDIAMEAECVWPGDKRQTVPVDRGMSVVEDVEP